MDINKVEDGMRVKTNPQLGETTGMLVVQKHLDACQPNKEGVLGGYVPGHGGDVWWVRHDDGTTGVYVFDEFDLA